MFVVNIFTTNLLYNVSKAIILIHIYIYISVCACMYVLFLLPILSKYSSVLAALVICKYFPQSANKLFLHIILWFLCVHKEQICTGAYKNRVSQIHQMKLYNCGLALALLMHSLCKHTKSERRRRTEVCIHIYLVIRTVYRL